MLLKSCSSNTSCYSDYLVTTVRTKGTQKITWTPDCSIHSRAGLIKSHCIKTDWWPGLQQSCTVQPVLYSLVWKDHGKSKLLSNKVALTASVFKAVDGIGQEADTPQESSSLLFVDLLVIPHADCDGIRLPDVSEEKNTSRGTSLAFSDKWFSPRHGYSKLLLRLEAIQDVQRKTTDSVQCSASLTASGSMLPEADDIESHTVSHWRCLGKTFVDIMRRQRTAMSAGVSHSAAKAATCVLRIEP